MSDRSDVQDHGSRRVYLLCGLLLLVVSAAGWMSYREGRQTLLDSIERQSAQEVGHALATVGEEVTRLIEGMELWAQQPVMARMLDGDPDREISDLLEVVVGRSPNVTEVVCLDRSGRVVVGAGPYIDKYPLPVDTDLADAFREGLRYVLNDANGVLDVTVPLFIQFDQRELVGMLRAIVLPRAVVPKHDVWWSAIVRADGRTLIREGATLPGGRQPITSVASLEREEDLDVRSVTVRLPLSGRSPAWRLVLAQPNRTRLAPVRTLSNMFLLVTAGAAIVTALLAYCFSRSQVTFTRHLAARTRELERSTSELCAQKDALAVLNESLVNAEAKAKSAAVAKSEFLANMSHEIRTPMNGIIGMTEIALMSNTATEQRESMETVLECANSLLGLLNDLLDFSKIDAGRLELESVAFDPIEVIENAAAYVAHGASQKGLELICDCPHDLPRRVLGDSCRLRQVLVNLIGNAIKFTEHGEVTVGARLVGSYEDRLEIEFSVTDTGIGIQSDRQSDIFEEFTQADSATTRKYGGTGLGLAICRRLVGLMGGEVRVASVVGEGSRFSFVVSFGPTEAIVDHAGLVSHAVHGRRLLVVDDNATNLRILERMLAAWGCHVSTAASGRQALEAAKAVAAAGEPFDVVLLDVQMPDLDGIAVAERLAASDDYGRPPVVFASSLGNRADVTRRTDVSCAAFLTKPLKQKVLASALAEVLSGTQARSPASATPSSKRSEDRRRSKARVLVVDDNPVNRKVAERVLSGDGYDVTLASDGEEAIERLEVASFDLVFMDVQMPRMDGLTAVRIIREKRAATDLPIVAMTAHAQEKNRIECLDAGMNDYLSKPILARVMLGKAAKWTATRQVAVEAVGAGDIPAFASDGAEA